MSNNVHHAVSIYHFPLNTVLIVKLCIFPENYFLHHHNSLRSEPLRPTHVLQQTTRTRLATISLHNLHGLKKTILREIAYVCSKGVLILAT